MDLSEGRDNNVSSGSVFSGIERAKLELCCSDDLIYQFAYSLHMNPAPASVFVCFKFSFPSSVHNTLMEVIRMTQAATAAGGEKHCNRFLGLFLLFTKCW